jgi:putative membrane protein
MKKFILALALMLVMGLFLFPVEGKAQMGPGMMGWGYGMGWFGMIIMAAFWIAVIVGIVFLIRWLVLSTRAEGHKAHHEDSALEILKKRYARGEIDKEEFEEKKKDLT